MSLTYVSQELNTYGGSVLLVIGTVGNAINIYIFSSVKTYRTTPCTFYFLIVSIHNIAYILINLPLRIIGAVYNLDLTTNSEFWCKARNFLIAYLGLTSFTCSCLTTVDQYFATSRSVRLRRFNTIRLAYRLVFITIIIWCLHGIPVLIFYNTVPVTGHCSDINPTYVSYVSVYVLIFQCGIPGSVMVLFGCLTYRNLFLLRRMF